MKLTILMISLLGILLTQTLANDSISLTNQGNDGGSVHQTVNINNQNNIANIDTNAGWNSWNSVWDYNTGFIAIRPFAKKTCYVNKMNRKVVPSLQELARLTKEKKDQKGPAAPPPHSLQYTTTNTLANNVAQFGKFVEALCKGVPTYYSQEVQGGNFFFEIGGCINAGILWVVDINICGEIGI
ncbi:gastrokine-1 [Microcaecilia unicolor]|uniref:Gastrokine-1 n=1 Tax=Microcaecilia unicolor TaxID=1415580 RepID=A0A6P7Y3U9_9AMPH|nr:gastrokine-1-like [Microcaecilia unicolor]